MKRTIVALGACGVILIGAGIFRLDALLLCVGSAYIAWALGILWYVERRARRERLC